MVIQFIGTFLAEIAVLLFIYAWISENVFLGCLSVAIIIVSLGLVLLIKKH